ncbi:MAG: radical SAM protein [Deltaproteobacteria bacterium]|nr:radical SAM protein [Deltaproteobacteria bacterium]
MTETARTTDHTSFLRRLSQSSYFNLIVSVTRKCALRCIYCYATDNSINKGPHIISDDLLEIIIRDAFAVRHPKITFEWTGGEALLAGKVFFEKVIHWQNIYKDSKKDFENIIQTSGAVYDEGLYDFLIDNHFTLSMTIDGPPEVHNKNRPLPCGRGSFDTVFKSFKYIKKRQGHCGVLCTLTHSSIGRMKEIFDFYAREGITSWHTNQYSFDNSKPVGEKREGITPDEYALYFKSQFDYWLKTDSHTVYPNQVDYLFKAFCGRLESTKCTHGGRCLTNFLNIDPEGNAYLCPKFIGFSDHRIGNIKDQRIIELIHPHNPRIARYIKERLVAINRCEAESCPYLAVCSSGCPYGSLLSGQDGTISGRDIMCSGMRDLYQHIDHRLAAYDLKTITKTEQVQKTHRLTKNKKRRGLQKKKKDGPIVRRCASLKHRNLVSRNFKTDRARVDSSQNEGIQPRQSQVSNLYPGISKLTERGRNPRMTWKLNRVKVKLVTCISLNNQPEKEAK